MSIKFPCQYIVFNTKTKKYNFQLPNLFTFDLSYHEKVGSYVFYTWFWSNIYCPFIVVKLSHISTFTIIYNSQPLFLMASRHKV